MGGLRPRKIQAVLSNLQFPNTLAKLSPRPECCVYVGGIKSSFIYEDWRKLPVHCKKKPRMKLEQQIWLWTARPPMQACIVWPTQDLYARRPWTQASETHTLSGAQLQPNPVQGSQRPSVSSLSHIPILAIFWFSLLKFTSWNSQLCSGHP